MAITSAVTFFAKRKSVLTGLAVLALASGANAQAVNFQGSTAGSFNGGAPSTSATFQNLTFNFGTFNETTSSQGFLALSSGQLGTVTLTGSGDSQTFTAVPFSLETTFTAPAGTTPSSTTNFATITGSITGTQSGGVFIDFDNALKTFTYTGGSFTFALNDMSVNNGSSPQAISGVIRASAVPEPGAITFFGTSLLPLVGMICNRRLRRRS